MRAKRADPADAKLCCRDVLLLGDLSQGIDYGDIVLDALRRRSWSSRRSLMQRETYVFLEPGEETARIIRYITYSRSAVIPGVTTLPTR